MLWHVIAPSSGYTKAANSLLRHPRLNSDAKVLLLHVQSLPPGQQAEQALSDHARQIGIAGRAYQKAKKLLVMSGFVHEWREQGARGFWTTEQLTSNVSLTPEEATGVRVAQDAVPVVSEASPSVQNPTVGQRTARTVGGYTPADKERDKNSSRPPADQRLQPQPEPGAVVVDAAPEAVEAERVLLSLRHSHRSLHLGVSEARKLVEPAVAWLRRGFTGAEMGRVLASDLPPEGVRSAVGFLRYRLVEKLPEAPAGGEVREGSGSGPAPCPEPATRPVPVVRELVACEGGGDEHLFRAVDGETHCGPCRREAAWALWAERRVTDPGGPDDPYHHVPWRDRVAALRV